MIPKIVLEQRIRRRLQWIIRNARESIAVVESLAENRPDMPPLDCEEFRLQQYFAERALAAFDAGDLRTCTAASDRLFDVLLGEGCL